MALTPSTNNDARPWHLTQKSYLTANNASSLSTNLHVIGRREEQTPEAPVTKQTFLPGGLALAQNRTTTSDNPLLLNRLPMTAAGGLPTTRTDESNSGAVRQSHHYHQRSLQRDQELERALEGTPDTLDNQTLQRASLEDSKASSSQNTEGMPPRNKVIVGLNIKVSQLQVQAKALED